MRKSTPELVSPYGDRFWRRSLERRDFLRMMSAATASLALPLGGCATHPVTGEKVLVGLSEAQEAAIDRQQAPHQYSRDFGPVQDERLNGYVSEVGGRLGKLSHRPQAPYSYRVVNANYVNAYTFPGGSMACTRGIMLGLNDEAELAALLGHETGHVNSRHAAQRAGQGMLAGIALTGVSIAASTSERGAAWSPVIGIAGQVGASALLSAYSRDNEREADALGMEYMTRAGYPPGGMVGLTEMLVRESKGKPGLLDTMFATHPMSAERLDNMRALAQGKYSAMASAPRLRERYMDNTASLRALQPAVEAQQRGERLMAQKKLGEAEGEFASALKSAPRDYTGLCLMGKCQTAMRRHDKAKEYLSQARAVYPAEAQAMQLSGINAFGLREYGAALQAFDAYERALPGDPNAAFFKGAALESMNDRNGAGREYRRYLGAVREGGQAQHAAARLQAWGMLK